MSTHSQPRHWNPEWIHRPVLRATEEWGRGPLVAMPENLPDGTCAAKRELSEMYWHGSPTWDEIIGTWMFAHHIYGTHNPKAPRRPKLDIAFFPAASGMVVLDCDVKRREPESPFIVKEDGSASLAPTVTEYGIEHLKREVERLGHSMDELNTYTVSTKSGGRHLYFHENQHVKLTTSRHRENWLVDVKARDDGQSRGWVAAPPTPLYTVINDVPVIELPTWLAEWLRDLENHFKPVGGERRLALRRHASGLKQRVMVTSGDERQGLLAEWVTYELQLVADAQAANSGWNDAIFLAAANLAEGGWTADDLIPVIADVAQPRTKRDENLMIGTIKSACGTVNRKQKWSTR